MLRLMLNDKLWSKLREIMLQRSAGATNKEIQAIGKSVAGNTTKIYMAVDGFGIPIAFQLTGGEVHDAKVAPNIIKILPIKALSISLGRFF